MYDQRPLWSKHAHTCGGGNTDDTETLAGGAALAPLAAAAAAACSYAAAEAAPLVEALLLDAAGATTCVCTYQYACTLTFVRFQGQLVQVGLTSTGRALGSRAGF